MDEKNKESKSLKDLYIEQECSKFDNMTEGQLADYIAENECNF